MKKITNPFVMILIGPTLSGKSTYIKNNYADIDVISRDEIVMEVHGSKDYNKAFKEVNHKEVDKILIQKLKEFGESKKSVIIDMTNMNVKRRLSTLQYFGSDIQRIAVIFPILSDEEYERRNINRNQKENKWIPPSVIKSMIESYQEPSSDEKYDIIIKL
jgi:predicted kinase